MPIVYETVVDGPGAGPAGDGTHVVRFGGKGAERRANEFVKGQTCYGRPAKVTQSDVPAKVYARWTREGTLR